MAEVVLFSCYVVLAGALHESIKQLAGLGICCWECLHFLGNVLT